MPSCHRLTAAPASVPKPNWSVPISADAVPARWLWCASASADAFGVMHPIPARKTKKPTSSTGSTAMPASAATASIRPASSGAYRAMPSTASSERARTSRALIWDIAISPNAFAPNTNP
ncbi:hypothetical protein D3C81_1074370 [compost metagenome]